MQRHKALMWRFLVLGTLLVPALALGGYFTVGGQTVLPGARIAGQLVVSTDMSPAIDLTGSTATNPIKLANSKRVCLDASCTNTIWSDGSTGVLTGSSNDQLYWNNNSVALTGTVTYWRTYMLNDSGANGGTLAINDADGLRSILTSGPFVLESAVAATGGTDTAFLMRTTATLAAGDTFVAMKDSAATSLFTMDYDGAAKFGSTKVRGTITLSAGTGTATVRTGAVCACTDTTANASVQCAVASTTLTATGTGADVIAYLCL